MEGGGTGVLAPEVAAVPGWENSRQGGMLRAFYGGAMQWRPGVFLVALVP